MSACVTLQLLKGVVIVLYVVSTSFWWKTAVETNLFRENNTFHNATCFC